MSPSAPKGVGRAGAYPASFETWRPMEDMTSGAPPPKLKIWGTAMMERHRWIAAHFEVNIVRHHHNNSRVVSILRADKSQRRVTIHE